MKNRSISIAFLIVVLSLFTSNYANAQKDKKVIDNIIAVVGNNVILKSDIENQYMQLRAQGYYSDGDLKCEIFEEMLFQKLLLHQADLDSIEVSQKEVDDNMNMRLQYFINSAGSEEKLEEMYGKSLSDIKDEFRNIIREQMVVERMQNQITSGVKTTPAEIRDYFNSLPQDSLPIIEDEFSMAQIVIYPEITKQAIEEVKEKLEGFKERIENGTPFATLAVLYSQDPGSATKGGELGYVGRGDLDPAFAAAAFNLKGDQISRVVESEFGYHIIQLIDKKGDLINVRHILLMPDVGINEIKAARNKLDSIRTAILDENDSLTFEKAVEKYSQDDDTKYNNGTIMNMNTGSIKFQKEEMDAEFYNKVKNLKNDDISQPFGGTDNRAKTIYKIVKMVKKKEKHVANLTDDYDYIQELALADKKQKVINSWIKRKQEETYIRINDPYNKCAFQLDGWIK